METVSVKTRKEQLKEAVKAVQVKLADLKDELQAIETLERLHGGNVSITVDGFESEVLKKNTKSFDPKGNRSWKDYILNIFEEATTPLSTSNILDYILANNEGLEHDDVYNAVRQAIHYLNNAAEIERAAKSGRGYLYVIKK